VSADRDRARYEQWTRDMEAPADAVAAATVILLRDGVDGLEVLMLRRNSAVAFVGGMWVFPGGRVDEQDLPPDPPGDPREAELAAARRAAVREAREEADLEVDPDQLVVFSHWTPPPITPRRYLTWFFVAPAPEGGVTVDGGEIHDHRWMRPADAMALRNASEIEVAPPTWISLERLATSPDVATAMAEARARDPEFFATRITLTDAGAVALYDGDAGYADGDADRPGPRHRLTMAPEAWVYERT
jgi:8-oxo-dGTP pyrophosphatase MutT (NUDIX family)